MIQRKVSCSKVFYIYKGCLHQFPIPLIMEEIQPSWYALRTFNCQERKISRWLTEKGCAHFIPMTYSETVKVQEGEKPKRVLVPVVHNLIFIEKSSTEKEMLGLLEECVWPVSLFRKADSSHPCEIPARDMVDLRMLCDPSYTDSQFLTQGEAEAMEGKEVRVVHGPFKGAVGRLVRKQKHYYFLKVVAGLGVMVRVSRWYCEAV